MAGRYENWHHRRGGNDRPDLVSLSRKMLGFLEERRRASGNQIQAIERTLLDGSVIRAYIHGGIPKVEIITKPTGREQVKDLLGGFVLWPSNDAGDPADPESPRAVLTPKYKALLKETYRATFPDYTDTMPSALGELDGLSRAGNVDWQGKGGWAFSWYGPRSRYIDNDAPRTSYVFFKGQVLLNAEDYITAETMILGVAVFVRSGAPWLIVVSEDARFGLFEDVWAVPITGKATDASIRVGAPVLLYTRTKEETGVSRHPVFFNPEGTEGRRITDGNTYTLEEHVFTIASIDESPGIEADFQIIDAAASSYERFSGYSQGENWQPYYAYETPCHYYGPNLLAGVPGTPPANLFTPPVYFEYDRQVHNVTAYLYLGPSGIGDWVWQEDYVITGDPWQKIAVDYMSDGAIAYAYGHIPSGSAMRSGDKTVTYPSLPDGESVNGRYVVEHSPYDLGGGAGYGWQTYAGVVASPRSQAYSHGHAYTSSGSGDYTASGIRLNAVTHLATNSSTQSSGWTHSYVRADGPLTGSEPPTQGDTSWEFGPAELATDPTAAHGFNNPVWAANSTAINLASTTNTHTGSAATSSEEVSLFLAYMDLRHDVLFVAKKTEASTSNLAHNETYTVTYSPYTTTRSGSLDESNTNTMTWSMVGHVGGVEVLNHSVVTLNESNSGSTPLTHAPGYTDQGNAGREHDASWPYPTIPALAEYPHVPGQFYSTGPPSAATSAPPESAYSLSGTGNPAQINFTAAWSVECSANDETGTGNTSGGAGRAYVRWKEDLDGIKHCFGFSAHTSKWAASVALPSASAGALQFYNACGGGPLEPRVPIAAEHFYPIWLLPNTAKAPPARPPTP